MSTLLTLLSATFYGVLNLLLVCVFCTLLATLCAIVLFSFWCVK